MFVPSHADFEDRARCPLCGAAGPDDFAVVHDFEFIPVRRCTKCGMMHSTRVLTAAATRRYYAEVFGSEFHQRGQEINAAVNLAQLGGLLASAQRSMADIRRVVDVGCGYGYFLRGLKGKLGGGAALVGIEVSQSESDFARDQLGLDVKTGMLGEVDAGSGTADLVTSYEVIEHVVEPSGFVRQMADLLKPGGVMIIGTDNFAAPIVARLGAGYPKWIPHTHVSHFEPETLKAAIRSAGCEPIELTSYTPWETQLRAAVQGRKPARPAREAWRFADHLATEMTRGYPLFFPRKVAAAWWSGRMAVKRGGAGTMMTVVAVKARG